MVRARTLADSSTKYSKLTALYELCAAPSLRTTHSSLRILTIVSRETRHYRSKVHRFSGAVINRVNRDDALRDKVHGSC